MFISFSWAQYSPIQAGVRFHTLLDLRGSIPSFIDVVRAKGYHESLVLDRLIAEPGSFYIMDRGYLSFKRLYALDQASAFFVVRSKKKIHHRRLYSYAVDKSLGLRSDQTVVLTGKKTDQYYPEKLRRVVIYDKEYNRRLILFTNNFQFSARTITELYIILQILSVSAFEKIELSRLLNDVDYNLLNNENNNQLELFNL